MVSNPNKSHKPSISFWRVWWWLGSFDFLGFNLRVCCFAIWGIPSGCLGASMSMRVGKLGCRQPTFSTINRKVLPVSSLLRSLADGAICLVFVVPVVCLAVWNLQIFLSKICPGARIFQNDFLFVRKRHDRPTNEGKPLDNKQLGTIPFVRLGRI